MKKAKCFSDIHYDIGKIDDKMYSSFTEHLGRSIYTGIYEPGHPNADENGYLHNDGVYAWTTDEVDQLIKSKNKNASSDELLEMGKNYSIEDTIARHGK